MHISKQQRNKRIQELYFTGLWKQCELAQLFQVSQPTVHRAISE